jgi:hypothetical protein
MTLDDVKAKLFRAGWWLYFKSRFIQNWSRFYRWLYERGNANVPVTSARSFVEMAYFVERNLKWVPDGARQLWNVFKSPEYVQRQGWFGDGLAGDCTAFAVWLVATLNKGVARNVFEGRQSYVYGATILSVGWAAADGRLGGHDCCLISRISIADGVRRFAYMDYHLPSPWREDVEAVIADILNRYAAGGRVLCWSVTDGATLAPIEVHV